MEDTGQHDAAESKDPDDTSREDAEISEKEGMKAPASGGVAEDHAQAKSEAHDGEAMAAAGKDEGEPAKVGIQLASRSLGHADDLAKAPPMVSSWCRSRAKGRRTKRRMRAGG